MSCRQYLYCSKSTLYNKNIRVHVLFACWRVQDTLVPTCLSIIITHRLHEAPEQRVQQHQLPRLAHAARQRQVHVVSGRGQQHGPGHTEPHHLHLHSRARLGGRSRTVGRSERVRPNEEDELWFQNKTSNRMLLFTFDEG